MASKAKKNNFVKDALVLCIITLVAGALLGLAYEVTKGPIKKAEDAAKTAILYGAVSGSIALIVELIDSYTNLSRLKERSIIVESDFLSDKSEADISISLSISVYGAIKTLLKSGFKYFQLKNKKAK